MQIFVRSNAPTGFIFGSGTGDGGRGTGDELMLAEIGVRDLFPPAVGTPYSVPVMRCGSRLFSWQR
jgi:hypothetical protein